MRRQLADILGLGHEAGVAWLQYAKLCRSTGGRGACCNATIPNLILNVPQYFQTCLTWMYQTSPLATSTRPRLPPISPGQPEAAATATLEAMARQAPGAALERAKLLWQMGKQHRAMEELQMALKGWEAASGRVEKCIRDREYHLQCCTHFCQPQV